MIQFDEKQRNRLFNGRFFIKKRISSGSFGVVFLCQDLQNKDYVAMKVEKDDTGGINSLDREIKMLEDLKKVPGVPKLLWAGNEHGHNCLVLQLLGRDLSYHLKALKRFSLKCVVNIGIQLIGILEGIHRKGVLHRDMKPENIMTGRDHEQNTIYIADFGISKYFREPDGQHIQMKDNKPFVGTTRYASINAHKGYELSRRDDLESLGYVLIFLLKGSLPWQTVHNVTDKEKTRIVGHLKQKTSIEELCSDIPVEFIQYFQCVRDMQFRATPDYRYLTMLFESVAIQFGFKNDKRLDWTDYMALASTKDQQTQIETRKRQGDFQSQKSNDLLKLPSMKSQKRNRSRHQSESNPNVSRGSETSSYQNSNQSSININYQNSQFSNHHIRLGSSKLLSKLQLAERNPLTRKVDSKHSINNSQKSLIQQQSEFKSIHQGNSQFANQFAQEDFQDLEELEERLQKDKSSKHAKNLSQNLKVKEVYDYRQHISETTNMTGLTYIDDECGIGQKLSQFNSFQTKFKEKLAKY